MTSEEPTFEFDELDERAKDKVRDWFHQTMDYEWWDGVYDIAKEEGKERGFDIDDIRFSGFWSQGDGASWTGSVDLGKFMDYILKEAETEDSVWHRRIGKDMHRYTVLRELMREHHLVADRIDIRLQGHLYVHSGCMRAEDLYCGVPELDSDVTLSEGVLKGANVAQLADGIDADYLCTELVDEVLYAARDYADDIYKQLEKEYDYLTSDESIAASCEANEHRFTETGELV